MTFEEFKEYYKKHGRCPNDAFKRKNSYTIKQFKTRYKKYCRKQNNKQLKSIDLRQQAMKRDKGCQLYKKLHSEDKILINSELYGKFGHLDMAHILNKSSYPELKYNINNVVMISRLFHTRLDTQLNPLTGKRISKDELTSWWMFIIGDERYEKLLQK